MTGAVKTVQRRLIALGYPREEGSRRKCRRSDALHRSSEHGRHQCRDPRKSYVVVTAALREARQ